MKFTVGIFPQSLVGMLTFVKIFIYLFCKKELPSVGLLPKGLQLPELG